MRKSRELLTELLELCNKIIEDEFFLNDLDNAVSLISKILNNGGTIFACGNGGSFTTAAHLTEELLGRYKSNRHPYPAICLASEPSSLTCIANDFGFEKIFEREFSALAKKEDCLIVFSTSGNSANIINALKAAKKIGTETIGILGKDGGHAKDFCDISIIVPHGDSARIQEIHSFILHAICESLEKTS